MSTVAVRHPAKFSDALLPVMAKWLEPGWSVLDPFAGTGKVHRLGEHVPVWTLGVEIEPEWAAMHYRTIVGDALNLPIEWTGRFDAVVTSPTYGNRMADHHEAKDASTRHTYRHALGRPLSEGSSAGLQWGRAYRDFHSRAWAEVARVLCPGGRLVLNVSNHIRRGAEVPVVEWHVSHLTLTGWTLESSEQVETPRQRHGQNGRARVAFEYVLVFERP